MRRRSKPSAGHPEPSLKPYHVHGKQQANNKGEISGWKQHISYL